MKNPTATSHGNSRFAVALGTGSLLGWLLGCPDTPLVGAGAP
jgi:hypothetical protein